VLVAVNGTTSAPATYTVEGGTVRFGAAHVPAAGRAITAGFSFDVPVRFDTDFLEIDLAAFEGGAVPDIPLIEVRL
jgi:uncharacterized protein (TIGR02217 family)